MSYAAVITLALVAVLALLVIAIGGNQDLAAENRDLKAIVHEYEIEDAIATTEEIDLAAVVSKALHPSAGLRPLGVVVSLEDRRGGA